jgi:hypothetical protein
MKKKFKILILVVFYLLNVNINSYAEQACDTFYKDVKQNFNEYDADVRPTYEYNDFGFQLQLKFNPKPAVGGDNIWIFDTNKEGYFKVGKITDSDLVGVVSENDLLISANNIDLRKENLSMGVKELEDIFEDKKNINFVFKNSKKYNLTLQKKKRDIAELYTDVYIRSVEISEKTNKINAGLVLSYQYTFEEVENNENLFYKSAIRNLMFEDSNEKDYTQMCVFSTDEWKSLRAIDPSEGFGFINIHSINQSMVKEKYTFKPYSKKIAEQVDLGWANDFTIDYESDGIFTFKTDFDLRNFPFDKQKIEFYLVSRFWSMGEQLTYVSDYAKRELINFSKMNDINGWNIVSNTLSYEPYKGPNYVKHHDGIKFVLEIERKHSYYLYKVIIPILLILMVCWSSLWLSPREVESRLTITIVCLLSLIAYNFVIDKEIPKLEYLTILDWIILVSYVYATIPNFLSIYSHRLIVANKKKQCLLVENIGKRYGIFSYLLIVFLIIGVNVNFNPENASAFISWMGG